MDRNYRLLSTLFIVLISVSLIDAQGVAIEGYAESEVVADCVNGVQCSDEKDQENRRNQLKVLGLKKDGELARKSLAQIVREEFFMKESFEDTKIVEFKEGDEEIVELAKSMDFPLIK